MSGAGSLLTLDRGNSTLDCMLSGETPIRRRLAVGDRDGLRQLHDLASDAVEAIGCTVVVGGLRDAAAVLHGVGVPLRLAAVDLPCPLTLNYPQPATLGVDRWVAALAAQRAYGDAIVVDCGSAVTVDAVTAGGVFLGGAIAPGVAAMAAGLHGAAPALPAADPRAAVDGVPVTSADAVHTGVELAFCGAVERLVREMMVRGGLESATTVLTGGDAEIYARRATLPFEPVNDLVHRGLRCLWQIAAGTG